MPVIYWKEGGYESKVEGQGPNPPSFGNPTYPSPEPELVRVRLCSVKIRGADDGKRLKRNRCLEPWTEGTEG